MEKLINEILGTSQMYLKNELYSWCINSNNFYNFCVKYKKKITKKISTAASIEDKLDIKSELEIAKLFCTNNEWDIEYEKYNNLRSPDFTLTGSSSDLFNIEVARIRATRPMKHYSNLITNFYKNIRNINSPFLIYIDWIAQSDDIKILDSIESEQKYPRY